MSQPKISKISKSECPEYEIVPDTSEQLPDSSVVLNLSDLAANYSQCVPFRFQVVNGFMAENVKDPTISVYEVYSVHLVKEIKVVVVKLNVSEFKVPVNSALRFGLVHENAATVYETVEEILSTKHLPKVVSVVNRYIEDKFTLRKNEILLVKDVVKGKLGRSKTTLRVFSMSSYTELMLPKDCSAQFSTDPQLTRLYLTDLLKYATDFMPCQARIYPVEGSSFQLTELLLTNVITMDREETHRSVVVSLFRDNPTSKRKKETNFIDIPTTINIRVSVIKTDKSDEIYQRIYEESENLLTDYNPSKIQACVDASIDDDYMTQAQLLAEIRKEMAKKEIADSAPPQYQKLLTSEIESVRDKAKKRSSSNPHMYQRLVTSDREPETSHSNPAPAKVMKEKVKKQVSNPAQQQYQKLSAGDRELLTNYESAQHSPVPRPSLDKPKPSNPRGSTSSQQSHNTPKLPPRPSKPAAGSPKVQRDEDRRFKQSKEPGRPSLAELDDVSLTTEEKLSMWRDSITAAKLDKKQETRRPPETKPKKKKPTPKPHDTSHDYEDLDSFRKISPPHTTSSWSSPAVQKKGSMDEVPSSKSISCDIKSSPDGRGKDVLGSEKSLSPRNVPGDMFSPPSSYVKLSKPTGRLLADNPGDVASQKLTKKLSEITTQISEIQARQALFEEELFALKTAKPPSVDDSQKVLPNVVVGMSPADVQDVLSAAGLSQYRESFARESVDGEMFMILDEEILSGELGVTSKLHQLRILRMKGNSKK